MKSRNMSGSRVRRLRLLQVPAMSQTALAACVKRHGVRLNQDAISLIEHGLRAVTDIELVALARCLGVPAATLLGERSPR